MQDKRLRDRKEFKKEIYKTYHIFCWGEKTEKLYFEWMKSDYRNNNLKIKVFSQWKAWINIKRYLEKNIPTEKDENNIYALVLDRDPGNNTKKQFEEILDFCIKNRITLIISNKSFELRYILHFKSFFQEVSSVKDYMKILDKLLWYKYSKKTWMYEKLKPLQNEAIKNAKTIKKRHEEFDFIKSEPYTNVYELIEIIENNFKK